MAIHDADDLMMPPTLRGLGWRERRWILGTVKHFPHEIGCTPVQWSSEDGGPYARLEKTLATSRDPAQSMDRLRVLAQERVIPEKEIEWIHKKDQRVLAWVLFRLYDHFIHLKLGAIAPYPQTLQVEQRYEAIRYALDLWPEASSQKVEAISAWKSAWAAERLPRHKTKWINETDEHQIEWAYNYLINHRRQLLLPDPVTVKEQYQYVLVALDRLAKEHPDTRELFLIKFRKTWTQYKYRHTGEAKKPAYMPLSEEVKQMLDELAEREGQPKYRVVERLIKRAYSQEAPAINAPAEVP